MFISYRSVVYSLFGGIISNLDNSNGLGFASYEKRTYNDLGLQLTKQNFGRKISNIANKYRNLLNNDQTYFEFYSEPLLRN